MRSDSPLRQSLARAELGRTFAWSFVFCSIALTTSNLRWADALLVVVPYGASIGAAVFVHRLVFRRWTLRLPFLGALLANVFSLGLLLTGGFAAIVFVIFLLKTGNPTSAGGATKEALLGSARNGLLFAWASGCAVVFLNEMSRRLGPGTFWRWISGRYHHPRIEERTFLFIDMAGSTPAAEMLGSQKFAHLLQECFQDATDAIVSTGAEVVNYVGDEIILAWRVRPGTEPSYEAYRIFRDRLRAREAEYVAQFGLVPKFRAAAHRGVATVAEVGAVRCQLTYLGDAMNTCARLLGYAGEAGHDFVASAAVAAGIEGIRPIGAVELRGKSETIEVFAF